MLLKYNLKKRYASRMNEKSSIINKELLEIQLKWKNEVVKCFLENHKEQQSELSHPFYFRVSDKYTSFEKKIMIVGQETKNWGKYSEEVEEDYLQNCSVEYLDSQLEKKNNYKYNRSPFWGFFRKLDACGYTPCWNNIDKLHRYKNGKTEPLTEEQKEAFCAQYGEDKKSLLQREIDIVEPGAIVFVIGPKYQCSLEYSFGLHSVSNELFELKPTPSCPCQDISHVINIGIPVIWSYHPNFLRFRKEKTRDSWFNMICNFATK